MAYGTFLNKLLSFFGMGLVLYAIAGFYQWVSSDTIIKHSIKCRYCRKRISEKVSLILLCFAFLVEKLTFKIGGE